MNVFSKLVKQDGSEVTPEELDEEDRLAFKRRQEAGRLGPRNMTTLTNGQIARMETRATERDRAKANRSYRRNWFATEQKRANLEGKLRVALGLVPSATPAMVARATSSLEGEYETIPTAVAAHAGMVQARGELVDPKIQAAAASQIYVDEALQSLEINA